MFLFILFVIVVCIISSIVTATQKDEPISSDQFWKEMDDSHIRSYAKQKADMYFKRDKR